MPQPVRMENGGSMDSRNLDCGQVMPQLQAVNSTRQIPSARLPRNFRGPVGSMPAGEGSAPGLGMQGCRHLMAKIGPLQPMRQVRFAGRGFQNDLAARHGINPVGQGQRLLDQLLHQQY